MTTDNNAPADDVVESLREVERFYSTMHEQSGVAKVAAKAAAEIERLRAERDEARGSLSEEVSIVNRIWEMYGSPSYEELAGRSIYDLISEERQAAQLRIRELEDGLRPFAFGGMTWLHGNKVMIEIDTAAIERARAIIERNSK